MSPVRARIRTLVRTQRGGRLVATASAGGPVRTLTQAAPAPLQARPGELAPATPEDGRAAVATDALPVHTHEIPPEPANPMRRTIWLAGGRSRWQLRLRRLRAWLARLWPWRAPSDEQRRLQTERAQRRAMEKLLREETLLYRQRITNALNRLGLCYRYKRSERDWLHSGVRPVRFNVAVMQPEAIYLHVDTERLPNGINVMALLQPDVLTDLTIACGQRVTAEYSERIGAWYIIERATGARGIPNHVGYAEMVDRFPEQADGLAIAFGLMSNNRPVFKSLSEMIHLLVAGTTGAGKSNFVNNVLCTWITRNSPAELQLVLVDLKGGMELTPYAGIPHLLQVPELDPIINRREQVPAALKWLFDEGERRMRLIQGADHRSIAAYNKNRKHNRLGRIVLVIDEWADIALDSKVKAEAEALLTNVAQRFRAVGIHVILCTQRPEVRVVSGNIKGVLPAKVAFNCANNASSMVILDNANAKRLEPVGRCVLQFYDDHEIQTPYMPDDLVTEMIAKVKAGQTVSVGEMRKHDVTAEEIMRWSLANLNGTLPVRGLYDAFRSRGLGHAELVAWLQAWEGQDHVVNGSLYRVEPSPGGTRARRLVALRGEQVTTDPSA